MKRQNKKVLLFLDNAPCDPDLNMSNVRLIFLPPNTTSVFQPLDLGAIKTFTEFYRKRLLRHIIASADSVNSATLLRIKAMFWML